MKNALCPLTIWTKKLAWFKGRLVLGMLVVFLKTVCAVLAQWHDPPTHVFQNLLSYAEHQANQFLVEMETFLQVATQGAHVMPKSGFAPGGNIVCGASALCEQCSACIGAVPRTHTPNVQSTACALGL